MLAPRESRAPVYNASDPKQVQRGRRIEKREQERLAGALRAVMGTPEGRIVIWGYMASFGVYREVFDQRPEVTAFNCGRQSSGREMMFDALHADEKLFQLMEHQERTWNNRTESEIAAAHVQQATEEQEGSM